MQSEALSSRACAPWGCKMSDMTKWLNTRMPCQVRTVYFKETISLSYSAVMPRYSFCYAVLLSHVWLFETPWTVARQAPLSIGILQARILEWVAMPSSRRSSQPRDQTQVSHIAGRFFTIWATREAHIILFYYYYFNKEIILVENKIHIRS